MSVSVSVFQNPLAIQYPEDKANIGQPASILAWQSLSLGLFRRCSGHVAELTAQGYELVSPHGAAKMVHPSEHDRTVPRHLSVGQYDARWWVARWVGGGQMVQGGGWGTGCT